MRRGESRARRLARSRIVDRRRPQRFLWQRTHRVKAFHFRFHAHIGGTCPVISVQDGFLVFLIISLIVLKLEAHNRTNTVALEMPHQATSRRHATQQLAARTLSRAPPPTKPPINVLRCGRTPRQNKTSQSRSCQNPSSRVVLRSHQVRRRRGLCF